MLMIFKFIIFISLQTKRTEILLDGDVFLKGTPFVTPKYKALDSAVLQMSELV
jgi:hypothetical protein